MITVQDGDPLPERPKVSMKTIPMAGILVDVYGLDELAARPAGKVACLWLHHARTRRKEAMADFASRAVRAWDDRRAELCSSGGGAAEDRGLVALAFDQRNHGTRLVSEGANRAWKAGNEMHATDMMGMIRGMVEDTRGLMDVVEGYLLGGGGDVDMHLVGGKSLGGHSAWQLMFGDERVEAGVIIVGCPDYMHLLTDRARLTKLPTYNPSNPQSFLGSKHFPRDLVAVCHRCDPKGILFGKNPIDPSPTPEDQERLRKLLNAKIKGKKFFVCSGSEDKLVPYRMSAPFMDFFETTVGKEGWYHDGGVEVQNRLYEGVGHVFSDGMTRDAVGFLVGVLEGGPKREWRSKI